MALYDIKFTDDNSNQWVKLANQYRPNFEKFIGFLINNLFDKYDIDELTDSTLLERGSNYWYGPHFTLGNSSVNGLFIIIEQLYSEDSINIHNELISMLPDLKKLTNIKFKLENNKYTDRRGNNRNQIRLNFDLDPYFDLDFDKLTENKMVFLNSFQKFTK